MAQTAEIFHKPLPGFEGECIRKIGREDDIDNVFDLVITCREEHYIYIQAHIIRERIQDPLKRGIGVRRIITLIIVHQHKQFHCEQNPPLSFSIFFIFLRPR
jgi:hypothetical protein